MSSVYAGHTSPTGGDQRKRRTYIMKWIQAMGGLLIALGIILAGVVALGSSRGGAVQAAYRNDAGFAMSGSSQVHAVRTANGNHHVNIKYQVGSQTSTVTPEQAEQPDVTEQPNATEQPDNETSDAAALAGKAKITVDQAKATALAANP